MADAEKPGKKQPPKGGRKGGTLFPKVKLQQAADYAKKLVSKTHTGPLPARTILPGVFGNAGPVGQVRASALKQYGLLVGQAQEYKATELAKALDAAPDDETRTPLLQRALLTAKAFSEIFQTFQGDTVTKAKIVQRAKGLKVHPDSADECADIFIDSALTAKLGSTAPGEAIVLIHSSGAPSPENEPVDVSEEITNLDEQPPTQGEHEIKDTGRSDPQAHIANTEESASKLKAIVNLNLTVDSSSDPDKLEKQLRLLKQFGML